MPVYSSRTVALALGLEPKELDNLLSRCLVRGVSGGTPGRNRATPGWELRTVVGRELRETSRSRLPTDAPRAKRWASTPTLRSFLKAPGLARIA